MSNKINSVATVVTLDGVTRTYTAEENASFQQSIADKAKKEREELIYPSDRELAEFFAVADSFKIKGEAMKRCIKDVQELKTREASTSDNAIMIACYGNGYHGKGELCTVWARRKATKKTSVDFGVRFSVNTSAMFRGVNTVADFMDAFSYRDITFRDNEPRYSFKTLAEITQFLATIYSMYENATAVKVAEVVTAEKVAQ